MWEWWPPHYIIRCLIKKYTKASLLSSLFPGFHRISSLQLQPCNFSWVSMAIRGGSSGKPNKPGAGAETPETFWYRNAISSCLYVVWALHNHVCTHLHKHTHVTVILLCKLWLAGQKFTMATMPRRSLQHSVAHKHTAKKEDSMSPWGRPDLTEAAEECVLRGQHHSSGAPGQNQHCFLMTAKGQFYFTKFALMHFFFSDVEAASASSEKNRVSTPEAIL